jgi:hypothetical protein
VGHRGSERMIRAKTAYTHRKTEDHIVLSLKDWHEMKHRIDCRNMIAKI